METKTILKKKSCYGKRDRKRERKKIISANLPTKKKNINKLELKREREKKIKETIK